MQVYTFSSKSLTITNHINKQYNIWNYHFTSLPFHQFWYTVWYWEWRMLDTRLEVSTCRTGRLPPPPPLCYQSRPSGLFIMRVTLFTSSTHYVRGSCSPRLDKSSHLGSINLSLSLWSPLPWLTHPEMRSVRAMDGVVNLAEAMNKYISFCAVHLYRQGRWWCR